MRSVLIAYVSSTVVLFVLDFIWISTALPYLYKPRIGQLLMDQPNLSVAVGFYLLYMIGVVALCIVPALEQGDWVRATWSGALLGLVAYGTYDLTNLATLVGWSAVVSVADMIWGTVVTSVAATAGYFLTRAIS